MTHRGLSRFRQIARSARHLPDRVLHSWRRNRARTTAAAATGPVLVLCYGNICRSPYAAEVLRQKLQGSGIEVISAGFVDPGRPSPDNAREAARRVGVSLDQHLSQAVTRALLDEAGLAVVMERQQAVLLRRLFGDSTPIVLLGDFDSLPIDTRSVIDPIDRDLAFFTAVYDRIDRCIEELATSITKNGAAAS